MKKANILLLGIGITYIVLAVIQWIKPTLFPISFYLSIAWASLSISILETIRSINQLIRTNIQQMDRSMSEQMEAISRLTAILQNYDNLKSEFDAASAAIHRMADYRKRTEKDNKIAHSMVTVENVLTIIQVVMCGLMLILTPLKTIPNDIENNKVLGILGLITFAFLFISAFFLSKYDKKNEHEKQMERNAVSNYYLNLMKKMTEEKEHKDATND